MENLVVDGGEESSLEEVSAFDCMGAASDCRVVASGCKEVVTGWWLFDSGVLVVVNVFLGVVIVIWL